jgi:hypothetical protein
MPASHDDLPPRIWPIFSFVGWISDSASTAAMVDAATGLSTLQKYFVTIHG